MGKAGVRVGGYHFSSDNIKEYIESLDKAVNNGYNPYKKIEVGEADFCFCYGVINSDLLLTLIANGNVIINKNRFDSCLINLSNYLSRKYAVKHKQHYDTLGPLDSPKEVALNCIIKSITAECGFEIKCRVIDNPIGRKQSKNGGLNKNNSLVVIEKAR